ncbi:hypothetical protein FHG87_012155 [Trinorchestia longiramus]|nr:hypothetical protein FHG87_012155 [Trinorchestia longiramus]
MFRHALLQFTLYAGDTPPESGAGGTPGVVRRLGAARCSFTALILLLYPSSILMASNLLLLDAPSPASITIEPGRAFPRERRFKVGRAIVMRGRVRELRVKRGSKTERERGREREGWDWNDRVQHG